MAQARPHECFRAVTPETSARSIRYRLAALQSLSNGNAESEHVETGP